MSLTTEIKQALANLTGFANGTLKNDLQKGNCIIRIICTIHQGGYNRIGTVKEITDNLSTYSSDVATHFTRLATTLKYDLNQGTDFDFQLEIAGDLRGQTTIHFPARRVKRDSLDLARVSPELHPVHRENPSPVTLTEQKKEEASYIIKPTSRKPTGFFDRLNPFKSTAQATEASTLHTEKPSPATTERDPKTPVLKRQGNFYGSVSSERSHLKTQVDDVELLMHKK